MAITRVGTDTNGDDSDTGTSISFSHTTPADCTLLILTVHMFGDETMTTPTWDGDNFTIIKEGTLAPSNSFRSWIWGFVNPGAKTATIAATTSSSTFHGVGAINFGGTISTSVAAAANFLSEDSNTGNTSTNVHASAGSAGNALFITAGWRGADITPSTVDNSFVEIYDRTTGASPTSDSSHTASWLQDSAPSAVTITMGGADQNDGILIELIPGGTGTGTGTHLKQRLFI